MSRVDSGLEWSCDSAYYRDTAGELATILTNQYGTRHYDKVNDGPAICAFFNNLNYQSRSPWHGTVCISTNKDYVLTYAHDDELNGYSSEYSTDIDGVTWYVAIVYIMLNAEITSYSTSLPIITDAVSDGDFKRAYAELLLAQAGVITYFSQQTIPVQFVGQGGGTVRQLRHYGQGSLADCHSRKGVA